MRRRFEATPSVSKNSKTTKHATTVPRLAWMGVKVEQGGSESLAHDTLEMEYIKESVLMSSDATVSKSMLESLTTKPGDSNISLTRARNM